MDRRTFVKASALAGVALASRPVLADTKKPKFRKSVKFTIIAGSAPAAKRT